MRTSKQRSAKLHRISDAQHNRLQTSPVTPEAVVNLHGEWLEQEQVSEIRAAIQAQQQNFLGELLEHAHRWNWAAGTNDIFYHGETLRFANGEGRDSLGKNSVLHRQA